MSMFQPPYPEGLPIGPGWLPAPERRAVLFPYDRSEVALAPWGSAQMAAQALEFALGAAPYVEEMPSHVRRAVLREVQGQLAATSTITAGGRWRSSRDLHLFPPTAEGRIGG